MAFQDRGQSVSSLLALLRSAQDGGDDGDGAGVAGPAAAGGGGSGAGAASAAASSAATPNPPTPNQNNSQLSALLAQLAPSLPPAQAPRGSAFAGASHNLLDPFGPVGRSPGAERRVSASASADADAAEKNKGKRKADEMEDRDEWSFTRCLPALTELLRDDEFVKELRKMKKDQEALERRLWARMEKIKAEQMAKRAADNQIAKITRKPVPAEKVAQWERELQAALSDLFVRQVLPSFDGLEARQAARLTELGVPGLGGGKRGEDAKARQVRVRRIMGVLEGALD